MPTYIALLRAVNVGGTGKLPMAELKAMCAAEGFTKVKTFIASGNVVFVAEQSVPKVKASLERRLQAYAGRPVGVIIRTPDEMAGVLESNPFSKTAPKWTVAIFLDDPRQPTRWIISEAGRTRTCVWAGERSMSPMAQAWGARNSKFQLPRTGLLETSIPSQNSSNSPLQSSLTPRTR